MGAGKSDGAMDAANLIKPALARGIALYRCDHPDEYRKYVEKDAALARFRPLVPSRRGDTISSCVASEKYERTTVRIADAALVSATLSNRYITDRFRPTRRSTLWMRQPLAHGGDPSPKSWCADRQILQMQIEEEALKLEDDAASKDRWSISRRN